MESKGLKVLVHASAFFMQFLVPFIIFTIVIDDLEVKRMAISSNLVPTGHGRTDCCFFDSNFIVICGDSDANWIRFNVVDCSNYSNRQST